VKFWQIALLWIIASILMWAGIIWIIVLLIDYAKS
jgi:hypothetical protein